MLTDLSCAVILEGQKRRGRETDMAGKKERVLTEAEQRRSDRLEQITLEMQMKGYRRQDLTIDIVKANVILLVTGIPFAVASIVLFFFAGWTVEFEGGIVNTVIQLVALLALTAVHELIHGFTWSLFCENGWKDIEFGFIVKNLTPYCTCATPLPKRHYILGALMPLIVLGIIPYAVSFFIGNFLLLMAGIIMILGAGGDIMLVMKLLRFKGGSEDVIYDHPTEAGSVVFTKQI